jgi:hypothetical protein
LLIESLSEMAILKSQNIPQRDADEELTYTVSMASVHEHADISYNSDTTTLLEELAECVEMECRFYLQHSCDDLCEDPEEAMATDITLIDIQDSKRKVEVEFTKLSIDVPRPCDSAYRDHHLSRGLG